MIITSLPTPPLTQQSTTNFCLTPTKAPIIPIPKYYDNLQKMSGDRDSGENTEQLQQINQQRIPIAGGEQLQLPMSSIALQQFQMGINAFLMMQQIAMQQQLQQQQQQQTSGMASSSTRDLTNQGILGSMSCLPTMNLPKTNAGKQENSPSPKAQHSCQNDEEKRQRDLTIIGKRWQYVSDVSSFVEFEQLRCRHQVSRNRTFAHGIRYSCTQKTQLRSNCPYLLLCLFSDGAGEHSEPGVGTISVYSRNEHTHPVKLIKARQPRRFAKLAKKRRTENTEMAKEEEEDKLEQNIERTTETNGGGGVDPKALIEMLADLSKQLGSSEKGQQ